VLVIILLIGAGFALLFKGGDFLVTGAAGIARKKHVPPFIAFHGPIIFTRSNLYDYLNVSILSFLFMRVTMTRQSFGRLMGIATLAYYPLSLYIRIMYLN
jgi:Ca2+/Na+ antiporter